jgi:hypothetical protein
VREKTNACGNGGEAERTNSECAALCFAAAMVAQGVDKRFARVMARGGKFIEEQ